MADGIHTFRRTLKLPCYGVADARPFKTHLDTRIKETVTALTANRACQWKATDDESGNIAGVLTVGTFEISLQTVFGQNTAFVNGARQTFVSYGFLLESRPAGRSAKSAVDVFTLCKIIGGILGPVVFYAIFFGMSRLSGQATEPWILVVAAVLGGVWCGVKLGGMAAAQWGQPVRKNRATDQDVAHVENIWKLLVKTCDALAKDYEQA